MSHEDLKNDNYNSNHIHAEKGVNLLGWLIACALLAANLAFSAMNHTLNRATKTAVKVEKEHEIQRIKEIYNIKLQVKQCQDQSVKN
tara:strand:- start:133 stop:393 length:261 start_codon:yes stop_codon:yes gene_type:complete